MVRNKEPFEFGGLVQVHRAHTLKSGHARRTFQLCACVMVQRVYVPKYRIINTLAYTYYRRRRRTPHVLLLPIIRLIFLLFLFLLVARTPPLPSAHSCRATVRNTIYYTPDVCIYIISNNIIYATNFSIIMFSPTHHYYPSSKPRYPPSP